MTTEAHQIVDVLAKTLPDDGAALAQREGLQALVKAQTLKQVVQNSLGNDPSYRSMWQQFLADPQTNAPILVEVIQVLCQNDPILTQRLNILLCDYRKTEKKRVEGNITSINSGGGAYIGGAVQVGDGSQFAGRDQTIVTQDATEITRVFLDFYREIAERSDLSPTDKADIKAELKDIENELAKGARADEDMIRRRLRNVQRMAPDILDVVLTTFANPLLGLGMVVKKIAEKMKSEAEKEMKG